MESTYYVSLFRLKLLEWKLNLAVRNKFTVAEIYQLTSIWKNNIANEKAKEREAQHDI